MAALRQSFLVPSLVAVACRSTPAVEPPAHIGVIASVRDNPTLAVGALVSVTAPGAEQAFVEYGETNAYGERSQTLPVSAKGVVVPIIGLRPDAITHLRVRVTGPAGMTGDSGDLSYKAGPLPEGVPASLTVTVDTGKADGFLLVGLYDEHRETMIAAVVDRKGRVRWYWTASSPGNSALHFDRIRGNFLVMDGSKSTAYELDVAGNVVKAWRNTAATQGLDCHDFLLLPNGNAIMFGWEYRAVDSRPFFTNGKERSIRGDHTIDEIDPAGAVRFHWSSYDHVGLDEVIEGPGFDPANFDVVHVNAVELLPDGNLLASFRSTSSIVKIDRSSGAILWRLGGKKSDFTFVDDPSSGFSRQHDPHFLENGELMLFDNGNQHVPRVSRVVRYKLDPAVHTAKMTWEYHHDPEIFSGIAGSARKLPNGHVLVAWVDGLITEIDESRRVVWEAKTVPLALYRALWAPSLYP